MTVSETSTISQVHELLAGNGYEVSDLGNEVLRVRDVHTGISFQAALQENLLFMSVTLTKVDPDTITPEMMGLMLTAENGISTSSFQLYSTEGQAAITLNNFCTLQNMGAEDEDDILSLAGYLMADLIVARELLKGCLPGTSPEHPQQA
ncbi:MAG: hypothetical protein H7Y20_07065 [Bryobacteraceae bacterium]|nr:hypothetical protein [Bryobacteraceae bacterium]